jgi:hypothetical protein
MYRWLDYVFDWPCSLGVRNFIVGHPSIINRATTPWWIADFLPNLESEFGMLLCIAGMVPMYWPASKNKPRH